MKTRFIITAVFALAVFSLLAGCGGNKPHELERGGLSAEDLMESMLDRTMTTLAGITTRESAEESLPVLEEINMEFRNLVETKGDLSEAGQADLSAQAAKVMPGLKDNWRRINMSSYGDLLRPSMEEMIVHLTGLL